MVGTKDKSRQAVIKEIALDLLENFAKHSEDLEVELYDMRLTDTYKSLMLTLRVPPKTQIITFHAGEQEVNLPTQIWQMKMDYSTPNYDYPNGYLTLNTYYFFQNSKGELTHTIAPNVGSDGSVCLGQIETWRAYDAIEDTKPKIFDALISLPSKFYHSDFNDDMAWGGGQIWHTWLVDQGIIDVKKDAYAKWVYTNKRGPGSVYVFKALLAKQDFDFDEIPVCTFDHIWEKELKLSKKRSLKTIKKEFDNLKS